MQKHSRPMPTSRWSIMQTGKMFETKRGNLPTSRLCFKVWAQENRFTPPVRMLHTCLQADKIWQDCSMWCFQVWKEWENTQEPTLQGSLAIIHLPGQWCLGIANLLAITAFLGSAFASFACESGSLRMPSNDPNDQPPWLSRENWSAKVVAVPLLQTAKMDAETAVYGEHSWHASSGEALHFSCHWSP